MGAGKVDQVSNDFGSLGGWDDFEADTDEWALTEFAQQDATRSKAPIQWLWGGLSAATVAFLLPLLTNSVWLSIVGWFLGGIVAIGLLGVFFNKDTVRRASGWAEESSLADILRVVLVFLAFAAVLLNSWAIADVLARREW